MAEQILRPRAAGSVNTIGGTYATYDPGDPLDHATNDATYGYATTQYARCDFLYTAPLPRTALASVVVYNRVAKNSTNTYVLPHVLVAGVYQYYPASAFAVVSFSPGNFSFTTGMTQAHLDGATTTIGARHDGSSTDIVVYGLWAVQDYTPVAGGMILFFSLLAPLLGSGLLLADMPGIARELERRTDHRITPVEHARALDEYRSWTHPSYFFMGRH